MIKTKSKKHTIIKVLNHNTLICQEEGSEDQSIFFGKGIGFKKDVGDEINFDSSVAQAMVIMDKDQVTHYKSLMEKVKNSQIIDAVQAVVSMAHDFFNGKVSSNLQITLLDHINFAIERKKQNIDFTYPFLNELKHIYPKEYEFSLQAVDYLQKNLKDSIPDNELGFVVLHIHAALEDKKISAVVLRNQIMHECIQIIEKETDFRINPQSIYYARFANHIEYAIHRTNNKIKIENVMLDSIQSKCVEEYKIAQVIGEHLKSKYHLKLDEAELGYLALHIYNFKQK